MTDVSKIAVTAILRALIYGPDDERSKKMMDVLRSTPRLTESYQNALSAMAEAVFATSAPGIAFKDVSEMASLISQAWENIDEEVMWYWYLMAVYYFTISPSSETAKAVLSFDTIDCRYLDHVGVDHPVARYLWIRHVMSKRTDGNKMKKVENLDLVLQLAKSISEQAKKHKEEIPA